MALKENLFSVRRPVHHEVVFGHVGEPSRFASCGGHHVHVPVAARLAREGKLRPVGREDRIVLFVRVCGDAARVASSAVNNPDVPRVSEGYVRAIDRHATVEKRRAGCLRERHDRTQKKKTERER
jgi:hypothetical protein